MSEFNITPENLSYFTNEVKDISGKTRSSTSRRPSRHTLDEAHKLLVRNQERVYKRIVGVQEIMIEDDEASAIRANGSGVVKLESKTKSRLKVGDVIKLAPDELPEMPVKITKIVGNKLTVEIIFEEDEQK